jgi:hypothetical protein
MTWITMLHMRILLSDTTIESAAATTHPMDVVAAFFSTHIEQHNPTRDALDDSMSIARVSSLLNRIIQSVAAAITNVADAIVPKVMLRNFAAATSVAKIPKTAARQA